VFSSTNEVCRNFDWLRVVPWKSNLGDAWALAPRACLSPATCAASSAATFLAKASVWPLELAGVVGLLVEGGLEVLERQRVLEDRHVALGHRGRCEARQRAEHARGQQRPAGGRARPAEEVRAAVAGDCLRCLGERAVAIDDVEVQVMALHPACLLRCRRQAADGTGFRATGTPLFGRVCGRDPRATARTRGEDVRAPLHPY
jgi:hypothetical protein